MPKNNSKARRAERRDAALVRATRKVSTRSEDFSAETFRDKLKGSIIENPARSFATTAHDWKIDINSLNWHHQVLRDLWEEVHHGA